MPCGRQRGERRVGDSQMTGEPAQALLAEQADTRVGPARELLAGAVGLR